MFVLPPTTYYIENLTSKNICLVLSVVCVHDRRSHWTELHRGLFYKMLVIDTFKELKISVEINIL